MSIPHVSIIIPTYNSAKTIDNCLKSIKAQNYEEIEVIVVDNLSSDDTPDIIESNGCILISSSCDRAQARNVGASHSKGRYLMNIDSDMELDPGLVKECVKLCESGDFDALIVTEISFGDGYLARCRCLEKSMVINQPGFEYLRFIRRCAFENVEGYDPNLEAGEDRDFHERVLLNGYKIGRTSLMVHHNEGHPTLSSIIKKDIRYGRTMSKYSQKENIALPNQQRLPALYYNNIECLVRNVSLLPGIITIHALSYIFTTKHIVK